MPPLAHAWNDANPGKLKTCTGRLDIASEIGLLPRWVENLGGYVAGLASYLLTSGCVAC